MSYQPYQPMGNRKEVSAERMRDILQKHAPNVFKAGESPKEKSEPKKGARKELHWKQIDKYVMQSIDGKWRVVKVFLGGKPEYELYAFTSMGWEIKKLHFESFDAARAAIGPQ